MIKILALDIDGVVTDGRLLLDAQGNELKTVSFRDIDAVFQARRKGLKVVLVTGESSPWVSMITKRLEVDHCYSGAKDKGKVIHNLCNDFQVSLEELCFVGDSLKDIPALEIVGLGMAPNNAAQKVKEKVHRVLINNGGDGAVAEAVEIVLAMRE